MSLSIFAYDSEASDDKDSRGLRKNQGTGLPWFEEVEPFEFWMIEKFCRKKKKKNPFSPPLNSYGEGEYVASEAFKEDQKKNWSWK